MLFPIADIQPGRPKVRDRLRAIGQSEAEGQQDGANLSPHGLAEFLSSSVARLGHNGTRLSTFLKSSTFPAAG